MDTLLLRRTFPELEASLITYFRRDVPRDLYENYNEAKHIVTWHNGSTTRFGYSASENDIYQYQGAEFLFIGIDELTLFHAGAMAISDQPQSLPDLERPDRAWPGRPIRAISGTPG